MLKEMIKEKNNTLFNPIPYFHIRRVAKAALMDFAIILASYLMVFSVRAVTGPVDFVGAGRSIILIAIITLVMLYAFGVYHRIWSRTSGHEISVLINAVGATTVVSVMIDLLAYPRPLPLSVIVFGNMFALVGFTAVRYRSRLISGASWRWKAVWHREFPKARTRVLIVGAGEAGQALAWRLKHRFASSEYMIIGYVDDDLTKQGMYVEGSRVLGTRKDIVRLTENMNIDLIAVAVHNVSGPDFREILTYCESTKARIKVVPDIFALMSAKHSTALLRDVQPEDLIGRNVITRHEDVDLKPVVGKVVLVTGAAGSIGSELSRQLCSYQPTRLILLDCNESGLHDLTVELAANSPDTKLVPVLADITFKDVLADIFIQHHPQVIFHAAAYKHVPMLEKYPEQAVRINIGGTRNVAELAHQYGAERFVLISTDKAVNPSSVMGASKRVCELLMQALSSQPDNETLFTSVRFGNVLGSRGSVVPTFNRQIASGGPVTITHPEMTRYFMSIPEAVNLVIHAACLTKGNEIFLLKMGEVVRIVDLAERMIRLRGMRPYKDVEIKFTGVRPGEKLHEQLYDGSAESAVETIHPAIVQLKSQRGRFEPDDLFGWIDGLAENGFENPKEALKELLWGMTPSEEYAASLN